MILYFRLISQLCKLNSFSQWDWDFKKISYNTVNWILIFLSLNESFCIIKDGSRFYTDFNPEEVDLKKNSRLFIKIANIQPHIWNLGGETNNWSGGQILAPAQYWSEMKKILLLKLWSPTKAMSTPKRVCTFFSA